MDIARRLRRGAPAPRQIRTVAHLARREPEAVKALAGAACAGQWRQIGSERGLCHAFADDAGPVVSAVALTRTAQRGGGAVPGVHIAGAAGGKDRNRPGAGRFETGAQEMRIIGGPMQVVGAQHHRMAGVRDEIGQHRPVHPVKPQHRHPPVDRPAGVPPVAGKSGLGAASAVQPGRLARLRGLFDGAQDTGFQPPQKFGIGAARQPARHRDRAAMGMGGRKGDVLRRQGAAGADPRRERGVDADHVHRHQRRVLHHQGPHRQRIMRALRRSLPRREPCHGVPRRRSDVDDRDPDPRHERTLTPSKTISAGSSRPSAAAPWNNRKLAGAPGLRARSRPIIRAGLTVAMRSASAAGKPVKA